MWSCPTSTFVSVTGGVAALFSAFGGEGPLLLVLDDVHWATRTMLQGVLDVARTHNGIALPIDINVARFPSPSASQNGD